MNMNMEIIEMKKVNVPVEFPFYLDAWLFCRQNGLDFLSCIIKKDFRTWIVTPV